MLKRLLGTLIALTISHYATAAKAQTVFDYTGSIQFYTIPTSGFYQVTAYGAQGGSSECYGCTGAGGGLGGLGAGIGGYTFLTGGQRLSILVGGAAANAQAAAGGGGGTFVVLGGVPLVVAGGGGGAGTSVGLDGQAGNGGSGYGGAGAVGGGGGGFFTNGGYGGGSGGYGGAAFLNGGGGGVPGCVGMCTYGGYGGGGGGGIDPYYGGGGGGGYSGGDGDGGGGTSYFDPSITQTLALSGVNSGNGEVIIAYDAIPEIDSSALKQGILLMLSIFLVVRRRPQVQAD
jgi:hypothetical protein